VSQRFREESRRMVNMVTVLVLEISLKAPKRTAELAAPDNHLPGHL